MGLLYPAGALHAIDIIYGINKLHGIIVRWVFDEGEFEGRQGKGAVVNYDTEGVVAIEGQMGQGSWRRGLGVAGYPGCGLGLGDLDAIIWYDIMRASGNYEYDNNSIIYCFRAKIFVSPFVKRSGHDIAW